MINDTIELNNIQYNEFNATSHLFYVINGKASIHIDYNEKVVCSGDIVITPCFNSLKITNLAEDELKIYYINDSPLVNYIGSKATKKIFKTAIYSNEFLIQNLNELSNKNNNRKGILLSNKDTEELGINTITPVLWALYNELPPKITQKPHKHNSVALDLCIKCSDSKNIYTLIGDQLDENGNIINPQKVYWKEGTMFITPPGLWHSHNNDGDTCAYILPIQDAGLLLYQRILGIVLTK
jgi:gentisate 1,2-dioxygenase